MAVSSIKDFWIHPNALTITLNYFGDPQLIQTSMLAGAVIMAYNKNYIGYDAAHNYREWKLQAFPTQLNDTCAYYVHAELSRGGDTAMIIYSPVKRDIEGRTLLRVEKDENGRDVEVWDETTSTDSYFIYFGTISASVDNDGATVERAWTDGFYTGTLATDQQRLEDAQGDWAKMFQLNAVTDLIEFLKGVASAVFNQLSVVFDFTFQGNKFTNVAKSSDSGDKRKWSDSTLPTAGYVAEEILDLDDHFLIKDQDNGPQSVESEVSFKKDISIGGDTSIDGNIAVEGNSSISGNSTVSGSQTIGESQEVLKSQTIRGAQLVEGTQEVKGRQTLHQGFTSINFSNTAGQIVGSNLSPDGVFTTAGIRTMSFEVMELIYNKIRAQQGKMSLSSTANIERCVYVLVGGNEISPDEYYADNSGYTLSDIDHVLVTFKEDDFNNGLIPFAHNDILYGYVNKIGDSGQYARGGQSCFYILSTNEEIGDANASPEGQGKMTVKAVLFKDTITDENGNKLYDNNNRVVGNMPPTVNMTVAHRGNINPAYPERMTSFFIDSQTGNIVMLQNVMRPDIDNDEFGVILGTLPASMYNWLLPYVPSIKPHDPVTYAKLGIFENLIRINHQGVPVPDEQYRGYWSQNIAEGKIEGEERYRATPTECHTVTHNGSLWKCVMDCTKVEPRKGIGEWMLLVAKGEDSAVANYDILPSTTAIYYIPEENRLSVSRISIAVGETTAHGYARITDQMILDEKKLTVMFSIDGGERTPISISTPSALALEGGTGLIAAEDGGGLILEGGDLDASTIKDNITLHLVRDYGEDTEVELSLYVIPVTRAGAIRSLVFTRSATPLTKNDTPKGGTYTNPIPDKELSGREWYDGIPSGTYPIYTSSCTFNGNGTAGEWSGPTLMADNADFEVMYSSKDIQPEIPAITADGKGWWNSEEWWTLANNDGWYDNAEELTDPKWMATNSKQSGAVWTNKWTVSHIKGEKGADGVTPNENLIAYTDWKYSGVTGTSVIKGWTTSVDGINTTAYYKVNSSAYDGHSSLSILQSKVSHNRIKQSGVSLSDNTTYVLSCKVRKGSVPLLIVFASSDQNIRLSSSMGTVAHVKGFSPFNIPNDKYAASVALDGLADTNEWQSVSIQVTTLLMPESVELYIGIPNGADFSAGVYSDEISLLKLERGTMATPYLKKQDDLAGPAGKAGDRVYLAGSWSAGKTYLRENGNTPMVYYDANETDGIDGKYYILSAASASGKSQSPENEQYWSLVEQAESFFTKLLLANFAMFGGSKGGVFWDRYLFSQYGQGGTRWDEANIRNNIFDSDGNLTGRFMPKLHLDFYNGLANFSCLCQPFYTPTPENGYIKMDPSNGFNISIPSAYIQDGGNYHVPNDENDIYKTHYPVVILPQFQENDQWMKNGAHVTVRFESGGESYGDLFGGTGNNYKDYTAAAQNIFLLVSVDDISSDGFKEPSLDWKGNYIFNNGRRGKYMILGQGSSVTLKSTQVKSTEDGGHMYWIVDNSGSVTEEVVDVYASKTNVNTNINGTLSDATVQAANFTRHQLYGADYSDDVIMKTSYYSERSRGIMFYSGSEGFCPKSILYTKKTNGHYRRFNLDKDDSVHSDLLDNGPTII